MIYPQSNTEPLFTITPHRRRPLAAIRSANIPTSTKETSWNSREARYGSSHELQLSISYDHKARPATTTAKATSSSNALAVSYYSNGPSEQPPPPIVRNKRLYDCIPLPSQVDYSDEIILHPLFQCSSFYPRLEWDLAWALTTLLYTSKRNQIANHLTENATNPALPSLSIIHPLLTWSITVHRSSVNPAGVTVFDVLSAITESLHRTVEVKGGGKRRQLDWLGSASTFRGLRKSDLGGDIWELVTAS